jgi:Rrf2 family protein
MALIARSKEKPVNAQILSESFGASINHLSKVLQRLVKTGFVESVRGPSGGFIIAKPYDKISFFDIYEALQGELKETNCPLCRKKCPFNSCFYEGILHTMSKEFVDFLKNKKLTDFLT